MGEMSKRPGMLTEQLQVRVTPQIAASIKQEAKFLGVRPTDVMRMRLAIPLFPMAMDTQPRLVPEQAVQSESE